MAFFSPFSNCRKWYMKKRECLGAYAQIVKPHTGDWGGNRQIHIAVRGGLALFEIRKSCVPKENTQKLRTAAGTEYAIFACG
ncbi:MAG: hypothetical protein SOZ90_00615 [Candidatus Faecousia sp.]|nr:hypothetical protein [Candidatus Faecousia sp.]